MRLREKVAIITGAASGIGAGCALAFAREGASVLQPKRPGPAACGPLSTFDPVVRWAALRVKRAHPAWGPAVVLDELRQRRSTRRKRLPHISQLAAYFQQFGSRLVQPRRHVQLPPAPAPAPEQATGIVFQLDMQERLSLPALGYFNVLNIRANMLKMLVGSRQTLPFVKGQMTRKE